MASLVSQDHKVRRAFPVKQETSDHRDFGDLMDLLESVDLWDHLGLLVRQSATH